MTNNNTNKQFITSKPRAVLLSGFLGSGKTSLLKHILTNKEGLRVAVIVNEITEENIDAYALGGTTLLKQEEKMVEMSNGCICCTLRTDLIDQIRELAAPLPRAANQPKSETRYKYDHIVIESSGISEPLQVAQTFFIDTEDGKGSLNSICQLDTCVTVVDASNILDRLKEGQGKAQDVTLPNSTSCATAAAAAHKNADSAVVAGAEPDQKVESIGQLTLEQLEFANVIVVNKVDKLKQKKGGPSLEAVISAMKQINPLAKIYPCEYSAVPGLDSILNTGLCTLEFAESVSNWMLEPPDQHVPETEEYGIRNVLFKSEKPFHPKRLHDWMHQLWNVEQDVGQGHDDEEEEEEDDVDDEEDVPPISGEAQQQFTCPLKKSTAQLKANRIKMYGGDMFRIKGYMWIGNNSRVFHFAAIQGSGDSAQLQVGGDWNHFPSRNGTDTVSMDPCQRVAFLGQNIDKEKLRKDLESLLLTDDEYNKFIKVVNDNPLGAEDMFEDPWFPWPVKNEGEAVNDYEEEKPKSKPKPKQSSKKGKKSGGKNDRHQVEPKKKKVSKKETAKRSGALKKTQSKKTKKTKK